MNTTKMIAKLNALLHSQEKDGVVYRLTFDDLREILSADDSQQRIDAIEKSLHGIWKELGESLSDAEKRIAELEKLTSHFINFEDEQKKEDAPAVGSCINCKAESYIACDCDNYAPYCLPEALYFFYGRSHDSKDTIAIRRKVAERWIQGNIGSMADMQDEIRKALKVNA